MKPLSEQLADLSTRAKKAEDDAAAAKSETKAKVQSRMEQLQIERADRKAKLHDDVAVAKDTVTEHWSALQTHVKERVDTINADLSATKAERESERAQRKAERAENNAADAIAFALDAVGYAESAVLDAVVARSDADAAQ